MKIKLLIVIGLLLIMLGCTKKSAEIETPEVDQEARELIFYNWEEYIGSETIEGFTEKTGIKVIEEIYTDEEFMLGSVKSNLSKYDLIVASDDLIREMREIKILTQMDMSKIPNIKNINKDFLNLPMVDPEQKYSIPYLWGTTGLIFNTKYIDPETTSWSEILIPDNKDRVALINNAFEVFSIPLKLSGNSINASDADILNDAASFLFNSSDLITGYFSAVDLQELLINEDIWAAQIYSGEGLTAMDENEDLSYIIPDEGAPVWIDFFAIPRDAQNMDAAYQLINYILEPEINAAISSELWYATANEAAYEFIDPEVTDSPEVYPDKETLDRCEYYGPISREAHTIIYSTWQQLNGQK